MERFGTKATVRNHGGENSTGELLLHYINAAICRPASSTIDLCTFVTTAVTILLA
jgi:hypothetical protein